MLLLVLSILALVIGVSIYPIIRKFPASLTFFDAFVLISIIGLTLLHLIPHSIENAGIPGLIAVAVGLGIPSLLHKYQHHHHDHHDETEQVHSENHDQKDNSSLILLSLIFVGVIIHTLLDGIGLSMSSGDDEVGHLLGLGVLFHRLPIGIFLGMMLVPRMGMKKTWGIVAALVTSTCIGFTIGHYALPSASITIMYLVQGLIAGSLLHVVFHNISVEGRTNFKWSKGLGALAGFGALAIVEWIAPVHAGHASVLDTWVDYLFNAAPIWCVCAAVMGLCYAGVKYSENLKPAAQKLCDWLDPQPLQAASGGVLHICSLTGIALLLTIYSAQTAVAWWVPSILALVIARFLLKNLDCCRSCRPESLCNREKSFSLWTASSWTLIAIATLLAAVLPSVASPLTEWFETLPVYGSILGAGLIAFAMIVFCGHHRGLTIASVPLVMFAILCLFHTSEPAQAIVLASGILLIFLYDFHARDIASSVEHDHPWKTRYVLAALLCLVLASAPAAVLHFMHETGSHVELTRIEPAAHHHHHAHGHAEAHESEIAEIGEHEHHGDAHEHHDEIAENGAHEHHDDLHEHHGEIEENGAHEHHGDAHEHHDEHQAMSGHAGLIGKMHEMPISFAAFVLFMLTGLFWILKYGPRHLFETIQGKHHHKHE